MFRKTLIALAIVTLGTALVSADASAQRFRGGGVHRVGVYRGVARGGWRGTGWRGAGWRGGVRVGRRSGWGWRAPLWRPRALALAGPLLTPVRGAAQDGVVSAGVGVVVGMVAGTTLAGTAGARAGARSGPAEDGVTFR